VPPLELENPDIDIQVLIKQPLAKLGCNACATADSTHGALSTEHAFGFVYKARSMTEIIARVEASQHLALYRLGGAA